MIHQKIELDDLNVPYVPNKKTHKYDVYLNDLKYKNKRNINKNLANWMHPTYAEMFDNIEFDSIEYRIYECIQSNGSVLDLSNMDLNEFPLNKIPNDLKQKIQYLFIQDNNLKTLSDLLDFHSLEVLDISHNHITKFNKLPPSLSELNCKYNELYMLPSYIECPNLILLNCENNKIKEMPQYNLLKTVLCGNNELEEILGLTAEKISCNNNKILSIEKCYNLLYLDCSNNPIHYLCDVDKLTDLIMNSTHIDILPNFKNLKYIEMFNTNIKCIQYFETLEDLFINTNTTKKISKLYKINKEIIINTYKEKLIHFYFTIKL
jgi:hypothetical protein